LDNWLFDVDGSSYEIIYHPNSKDPEDRYYSLLLKDKAGAWSIDNGIVSHHNDTIFFHSKDSVTVYYIYKDHLYNLKLTGRTENREYESIKIKKQY
jgi:hypothetical protein